MCQSLFRPQAWNLIKKETLAQVFSCEFSEIPKNTFFHRTPLVAASESNRYSFSIGTASRSRVSCFSSLFLTKVTTSIKISGVIRKSALNCCLLARSSLFFTYVETKVILGKRSKPFFQLWNQWPIIQYLNFVSEKIFFLAISIYGYCFCGVFYDY